MLKGLGLTLCEQLESRRQDQWTGLKFEQSDWSWKSVNQVVLIMHATDDNFLLRHWHFAMTHFIVFIDVLI